MPSAQRGSGSPGYHLPCPKCRKPFGREACPQALEQQFAEFALFRRQRRVVPLGAVHVVDGHERRLAAVRQADIVRGEIAVDLLAQRVDRLPLGIGVRPGDARVFVHAGHAHREVELDLRHVGVADHRRRVARVGGARERNVAFARQQARRRVEPDPARAGDERFGPRVQVGEIVIGAGRPIERLHVGHELNEVTRGEARGHAQMAHDLHQQPPRVAARAAARCSSVSSGVCTPGSMRTR